MTLATVPADPDRLPPHSIEAEQALLGCILLEPRAVLGRLPAAKIGPESFYDLRHQTLLTELLAMDNRNQPIDLVTVSQWLRDRNQLEATGGIEYLSALQDRTPSAVNFPYYAEIVREKRVARRVAQIATETLFKLHDTEPDQLLAQIEHDIAFLARGRQPVAGWPKPVSGAEWIKPENAPPKRPEIIHGLLRRGDKLILGGGSKSCKTWFAASLAIAVSAGQPFLGFKTAKTPALFINLELPDDIMWDRAARLFVKNGINPADCDIQFWNLRGNRNLSIDELDAQITAQNIQAGFIVLDPLYKLLGDRSENDAAEMTSLFQIIEGIAHRLNAAILIPAHFSKGNQSEKAAIDRISGSGAISRDADALVTMTAHEEEDAFTLDFTLRAYAPQPAIVTRWEYPLFSRDDSLDPDRLKARPSRDKDAESVSPDEVADMLPGEGLSRVALVSRIRSQAGVSQATAYRAVSHAINSGKVKQNTITKLLQDRRILE